MKISKLLLGTNNESKIKNYRRFLQFSDTELLTPGGLGLVNEPEETGKTLEENALLKARFYYRKTGLPTLADDAGFEIPALGNVPGVYSKRFAGHEMTDGEIMRGILEKMKGLQGDHRRARMRVTVALILPDGKEYSAEGKLEGVVPENHYDKSETGFPYRSLLYIPALGKWFYDLTEEEEEYLGYRKAALEKLKQYFI